MVATTSVAAGVASKKAVERLVESLFDFAKRECGERYTAWKTKRSLADLYKRLKHIRFVKTLWQPERAVDLLTFYYDTKLIVDGKRRIINTILDIPYPGNVVIEGTIGQGKSIFMRYLVAHQLARAESLPIFVTLLRLRSAESLAEHLLGELSNLGLGMNANVFKKLASQGKIMLFLDAFDELDEDIQGRVVGELEGLIKSYPLMRIVVSSRPERPISSSPFFRVFKLAPLVGSEYKDVIRRITHDDKIANAIIEGVSEAGIPALLTTPLMIALLVVRFSIEQSVPENAIAFYDNLLGLLLSRHDKSKGGYRRRRKSGLGDYTLQEVFDALCYLIKKERVDHRLSSLARAAKQATRLVQSKGESENILKDIVDITCLIITEGDEWRFVHKSVAEYHVALFIRDQPDESAAEFYRAMLTRWSGWTQELVFLETVDRYRFLKFFLIPHLRQMFGLSGGASATSEVTAEQVLVVVGPDAVGLADDNSLGSWGHISSRRYWPLAKGFFTIGASGAKSFVSALFGMPGSKLVGNLSNRKPDYTFAELIALQGVKCGLFESTAAYLEEVREDLVKAEEEVRHIEQSKRLFEF